MEVRTPVTISALYVLDAALDEAAEAVEPFLTRIAGAIARDLHTTGGSTLKRLRGPWGGRAFRVRWNNLRASVSVVPAADGGRQVYVHQVGARDKIYDLPAFRERLDRFHRELWSERGGLRGSPEDAGYHQALARFSADEMVESREVVVETALSGDQVRLVSAMVPFPESWGVSDAIVVIGKGPPGSGKTVAAVDAARRAVETCQYAVLLLVPTARLRAQYEDALRSAGIPLSSRAGGWKGTFDGVHLGEVSEFFIRLAGIKTSPVERERLLDEWWGEVLEDSAVRAWATQNPVVRESRFARLLDAVLEDPSGLDVNEKDALDTHDAPLYGLVNDFRRHAKWMRMADSLRETRGLYLRSEVAALAGARLTETDLGSGSLLAIVDEAQDLVHAEWKAVVDWCVGRCRRGAGTRVALIGDENQRISPTSFSWAEVKRHCTAAFQRDTSLVDEWELPGSFRLSRKIAALANELFHDSITQDGKFRHVERAEPADLPDEGAVRVVVVPEAAAAVVQALRRFNEGHTGSDRLRVIADGLRLAGWVDVEESRVDVLPPRAIKGLEFASLVVVEPLGGRGAGLSYGEATVAYTSLTRAIENLVCVLTPAEWAVVRDRWAGQGVMVEELKELPQSVLRLEELFGRLAGESDALEQARVEEEKLADLLSRLPSSGSTTEAGRWLRDISLPAKRLIGLGRLEQLARDSGRRLHRTWLIGPARALIGETFDRGDWRAAAGLLVLLGELAAAIDVVERWAPAEDAQALHEAGRRALASGDAAQRIALTIRRTLAVRPEAETGSVLSVAVADIAHRLVRSSDLPSFGERDSDA